ncbi:Protein arginine N-methyltransferase 7 [Blattella germanica]|nr:Protein arginine N-methyltransferase 7 [Blattella germanica]
MGKDECVHDKSESSNWKAFQPMAECARKVIRENGFEDKIRLIPKRSTEMTVGESGDLKRRANILKDCIVVPSLARVYAQVVSSQLAQNWNRMQPITDSNKTILLKTPQKICKCPGAAAVHDIQLSQFPTDHFQTIIPPTEVFRFDWTGKQPFCRENSVAHRQVSCIDGVAQVVFMWWDLVMDMDGEVILSCAPVWAHPDAHCADRLPWRDHWMQAVYYLPQEIPVKKDEEICLLSHHDDPKDEDSSRPVCSCGLHIAFGRTRIGAMNDEERNHKYVSALRENVTPNTVCLCLGDGSLLGPIASQIGAKKVFCIDGNSLTRDVTKDYIKENNLQDKITLFRSCQDFLSSVEIDEKVNLVIGEPHFVTTLLPWQNVYFWYLKNELSECLSSKVKTLPIGASVWAMAVQFDDLWKIRAPLHSVEGFKVTDFDKLIESSSSISDSPVEPQPLWEYQCQALTQPFKILDFNFTENVEDTVETEGKVICEGQGTCHGIALWVDWDLDGSPKHVISTGPRETPQINKQVVWDMHTRQGVFFFHTHKSVDTSNNFYYKVCFIPQDGDVQFHFDTSPVPG